MMVCNVAFSLGLELPLNSEDLPEGWLTFLLGGGTYTRVLET